MKVKWKNLFSSNVVLSHEDYPYSKLQKPTRISFGKLHKDIKLYFANVSCINGDYFTTGGRVMSMVYCHKNFFESINIIYNNIYNIQYKGSYFRRDIGLKHLTYKKNFYKPKIAVIGSTNGTSFLKLLEEIKKGSVNATVEVIITNRKNAGIIDKAKQFGISFVYLPAKKSLSREKYDEKINEINKDFSQLDTALKQYVNTFVFAEDGAEETLNITGNKANKDIKEKLKLLTQKKKLLLNETKMKKFISEVNEIDIRTGTLEGLGNYINIIRLKANIDPTKSRKKIKDYEDDFKFLKSKKLGADELENAIVQLNEEITKEENLIKSSVISLKEEIDTLDAELSEKKDLWKYLKLPIPFNPYALLQILKSISFNKDF